MTIAVERVSDRDEQRHSADFAQAAERIERQGLDVGEIVGAIGSFSVAMPSWAFTTGGTRFGRFPGPGEPRNIEERPPTRSSDVRRRREPTSGCTS
jgi:L-rhamnose isomerase/sugar isomerase